jgi:ubiquinone biosynthesis protein UbiJ
MITATLNRLLAQDKMALSSLKTFAGQCVALDIGICLRWQIDQGGFLTSTQQSAHATLQIDLSALPLLGLDRAAFNRTVTIQGEEKLALTFANTLANLEWDAEEALSQIVGDVLAHRLIRAQAWFIWPPRMLMVLAKSLAEYYQYESAVIVDRAQLMQFYQAVDTLRADSARLEKRILQLSKKTRA